MKQVSLASKVLGDQARAIDRLNGVGPYKADALKDGHEEGVVLRVFGCPAYDACLSYAARNAWDYFTCAGCAVAEQELQERRNER